MLGRRLLVLGLTGVALGVVVFVAARGWLAEDAAHPSPSLPDVAAPRDATALDPEEEARRAAASRQAFLAALDRDAPALPDEASQPKRILYLNDIDDIKHEIYEREIESVDRLHLLDELVQTGYTDTRTYWDRDWSGVDDWKEDQNGFSLQKTGDGTLIFHPDEKPMALYTFYESLEPYEYDPETHEFVSEVDYYGKPIRNVLKFINEDTLVMMTISGTKVDLNIYGGPDDTK